jgi:hypothetical protein
VSGEITSIGNNNWLIKSTSSDGRSVNFTSNQMEKQEWAYNMLQAFDFNACEEYPAAEPLVFSKLTLATASGPSTIPWEPKQGCAQYPCICNENATTTGSDNTRITWKGAPTPLPPPPSPSPPTPPAPPPAQSYKCIHDKCVETPGGASKSACQALCG